MAADGGDERLFYLFYLILLYLVKENTFLTDKSYHIFLLVVLNEFYPYCIL